MARAYDMKRLHMGCGESLQSQLPYQLIHDKYGACLFARALHRDAGMIPGRVRNRSGMRAVEYDACS